MLLVIESSANWPSVCLVDLEGHVHFSEEASSERSHAEKLPVFIQNTLAFARSHHYEILGVGINSGPGSYTGLRIGLSLAKGLCYGLNIPLVAVCGLTAMIHWVQQSQRFTGDVYALLDARRDEVYVQSFTRKGELSEVRSEVLRPHLWDIYEDETAFVGDAVKKTQELLQVTVKETWVGPTAIQLAPLLIHAYKNESFESVAYFEPFYLKDFEPGISKKFAL